MLLWILIISNVWKLESTGIYNHPVIAASPQFHFYMLDRAEEKILHFNGAGRRLSDISGPGQGPDRLTSPRWIRFYKNRLYISDRRGIAIFSNTGHFEKRLSMPSDLDLTLIENGWLSLSGLHASERDQPLRLLIWNESLTQNEQLYQWTSENSRKKERWGDEHTMYIDPAMEISLVRSDSEGRYFYVQPARLDRIDIFKKGQAEPIQSISIPGPRIPYNEKWGRQEIKKIKQAVSLPPGLKVIPDPHEFIPKIESWALSKMDD